MLNRRERRRRNRVVSVLSVLLVIALTAAGLAAWQQQRAEQQRSLAVSRQLVQTALALRDSQPRISLALSIAAFDSAPTLAEARDNLLSAQARYYGKILSPKTGAVHAVAFSPDSRMFATAQHDDAVCIWDVPGWHPACLHTAAPAYGVAFAPDSRLLAGAGQDGDVTLWDTRTLEKVATLGGGPGSVNGVDFSPDGRTLATAGAGGDVTLWNARTLEKVATLGGDAGPVNGVAFSPDRRTLATASEAGVGLWSLDSYTQRPISDYTGPVRTVAFSPDGTRLATGGDNGSVKIWNLDSRAPIAIVTEHTEAVRTAAFSPDGRMLATGGSDASVRLWDARPDENSLRPLTSLAGPTGPVLGVAFSPNGRTLASAGSDSTVGMWNVSKPPDDRLPEIRNAAVFGPDGSLATAGRKRAPLFWDVSDGGFVPELRAELTGTEPPAGPAPGAPFQMAFNRDGKFLAAPASDHSVAVWDLPARRVRVASTGSLHPVRAVAFSARGDFLVSASASKDSDLDLREIATLHFVKQFPHQVHFGTVNAIAVRPDQTKPMAVVTGGEDAILGIADLSGAPARIFFGHGPGVPVEAIAISGDGTTLASGSDDGTVGLWDMERQQPLATLPGNARPVVAVSFSHDGKTLASVSTDGLVRLWDVASRRLSATLTARAGTTAVAFRADGDNRTFATADQDGTPVVWDGDVHRVRARLCGELRPVLTRAEWSENVPDEPYRLICG